MSPINQVGTVFVPVSDQDRALVFYLDKLGFEKRADFAYGDEAYCAFATDDIEADHAALSASGVDVDAEIASTGKRRPGLVSTDVTVADPVPPQFFFRDLDGNRFLIVQP